MLSTDARGLEERNVGQKGKHIEEYGFLLFILDREGPLKGRHLKTRMCVNIYFN